MSFIAPARKAYEHGVAALFRQEEEADFGILSCIKLFIYERGMSSDMFTSMVLTTLTSNT